MKNKLIVIFVTTLLFTSCFPLKPSVVSTATAEINVNGTLTPEAAIGSSNMSQLVIDKSFLTGKPCAAPCWYGLELNRSTEQDVRTTISQLFFVDQSTIREEELGTNAKLIRFNCIYETDETCGTLLISGDKLKSISLAPGYELTFKMVVDQLGVPDQIGRANDLTDTLVGAVCSTSLYWLQISVNARDKGDCPSGDAKVKPDLQVSMISYSVPGTEICFCSSWPGFLNP